MVSRIPGIVDPSPMPGTCAVATEAHASTRHTLERITKYLIIYCSFFKSSNITRQAVIEIVFTNLSHERTTFVNTTRKLEI
jgi:hypothetical protein